MNERDIEQSLIAEILCGNKKAEEQLYILYKPKLSRLLKKKFPNNNDHDDDVSEILIKIFENIKSYDSTKSKFHSWVINIMKNYMIDKSRKHKPLYVNFSSFNTNSDTLNYSSDSGASSITLTMSNCSSINFVEPQSFSNNPYEDLEINDSLNFISNSIGMSEFSMLSLKYKDGYDYKEIGSEFNMKDSQVSNKINYTRSKFKKKKNE